MIIDKILERNNLKYEDLTSEERETLGTWTEALQQGKISVEKIRDYLQVMKASVEQELSKIGHESKQDIFLKARLRNYLLLEAFLSTPERARIAVDRSIAGFAKRIKEV